jgi:MoaA/NifB/PqqE/SkfB family radical SAM enzyme
LTTNQAKEKIRYLARNGCGTLTLTGGEPTLRKDFFELVKFAKDSGIKRVELQTNGIKLKNRSYVKKLENLGLNNILLAFHSHKPKIYDLLTNTKENFDKLLSCLENLNSSKIETHISHVINSENYKDILDFIEFTKKRYPNINHFYFSFIRPNGRCLENSWLIPKISDIEIFLYRVMNYCKKNDIYFEIEGVPLCYMQGFEKYCSETLRLKNKNIRYVGEDKHEDIHKFIHENLKEKSEVCNLCKRNDQCVGVWKEYADLKGVKELFPIF